MLTVIETIERELNANEKIALDNNIVCERLIQALQSQDKEIAVKCAQVLMLKAMCL